MPEQPSQPGQRNIASHGNYNVNNTGDGATFNIYTAPSSYSALRQLRAPKKDFTGREAELEELRRNFSNGLSVFGVQGMGGVGKTELALKLAEELKTEYRDAQFFVDLRGFSTGQQPLTAAEALSRVILSFNPEIRLPEEVEQQRAIYLSLLDGKRALVVWDNALSAEQIAPLAPPATCAMIVTSRNHFSLDSCHTLDLRTMPPADACKLLETIAPRAAGHSAEIARLCGYLPLALRLAAEALNNRHRNLTPEAYIRRLADVGKRMEFIAAALTVSYELLDERQQQLWRALSVFPATFDDAAAAAVWQVEEEVAQDVLGELIAASMIEFDDETRRYSLHNLARDFASAQASDDERMDWQKRHARHFCNLLGAADELYLKGGEQVGAGLALYDQESVNIAAGWEWAASQFDANQQTAELCLDYPDAGLYVINLRLHSREQIRWLETQLVTARRLQRRAIEGNALGNLGLAYANLGEARKAIEFYAQSLIIAREIGDRRSEGNILGNLGLAYKNLGEVRKAIEFYDQCLTFHREIGDRRGESNDLSNLGVAHANLSEMRNAIKFYEQALMIDRETGDRRGEGLTLGNLGVAYKNLGEAHKAIEFHEQSLVIKLEIGDRRGEGNALGNIGLAHKNLGNVSKAIEFYAQHLAIAREISDRRGEGNALWNIALAREELSDRAQAIVCAEAALIIYAEIESPHTKSVRAKLAEWRGQADGQ